MQIGFSGNAERFSFDSNGFALLLIELQPKTWLSMPKMIKEASQDNKTKEPNLLALSLSQHEITYGEINRAFSNLPGFGREASFFGEDNRNSSLLQVKRL